MVVSIKDNLEKRTVLAQVNQPLLEETILKSAIISSFATTKKKKNDSFYMKVLIHYNRSLPSHVLSSRLKYLKLRFNFYRVLGILSNIDRIDYAKTRDAEIMNTKKCWTSTIVILSGVDTDGESGKSKGPFKKKKKVVYNNICMYRTDAVY